jgi:hypothetical protein
MERSHPVTHIWLRRKRMRRLAPAAVLASVLSAALVVFGLTAAGAAVPLSGVVSSAPVSWTPNISAGTSTQSVCDQWFGPSGCKAAIVHSTAIVNGEVIVAGAFTQVCQEGPASSGHCTAGTTVTRDDIFAYQLGTGVIDPNFDPQLNAGPAYSVVAGPGDTVYVGGSFTTVGGASHRGLVQLNVTPSDAATDGTVVTGFTGSVSGYVEAMALSGSALYIGGQFATVDSTAEEGVARLNATTGTVDTTFSMPISNTPVSGQALKVDTMAVTASGSQLAIAGPFLDVAGQSRPRVALINTGGGLGDTATLANWAAPIMANNCSAEHDYVGGIDFAPNGSFFVIADTGYESSPSTSASVCDGVARFNTSPGGTDVQPAWINYGGGDSFYSVQITGAVVYIGGHNRFTNDECGNNSFCAPNNVLAMGLAAIDANTGLTIPWWQPLTERGQGTFSLTAFGAGILSGADGGLLIGNDVDYNAGGYHAFNALFPLTSTSSSPTFGSIPSGIFAEGNLGGHDEGQGGDGIAAMCVDDPGNSTTAGTEVEFETCTNAAQQNWTIQPGGNVQINGLCLDTVGQGTASDTDADVNTCGSSATQVWTQGTGNTLINKASGLCLDDPGSSTTNGTVLNITACGTGVNQVWPLPAAPLPASLTPTGPLNSTDLSSGSAQPACITDTGDSTKPGTAVEMYDCYGGEAAITALESNGNIEQRGLCLDTAGEGTASGTQVVLNTCGSSTTQVWTPGSQGSGTTLVNKASGLCLTASSTANGAGLDIAACSSSATQRWLLPAT